MNILFIIYSYSFLALSIAKYYANDYDEDFEFKCPTNKKGFFGSISRIESEHDNHHEDRRWHYECRHDMKKVDSCYWTGHINNYDKELDFNCPENHYIAGFKSKNDNHREDRLWRVLCCHAPQGFEDCKWSDPNDYDKKIDHKTGALRLINGLWSRHSNYREDRKWRFLDCKLKDCEVVKVEIKGKPQAYFKGLKALAAYTGLNCGSQVKKISNEHSVSYSTTTTVSKIESFEVGISSQLTVEAGFEGVGKVSSALTLSEKLGYSITDTKSESTTIKNSHAVTTNIPKNSAVLGLVVGKEYEYIAQRLPAHYTIKCDNGNEEIRFGTVDVKSHTFLGIDAGTLEEVKVNPNNCGAEQLKCISSLDASKTLQIPEAIEKDFKKCFGVARDMKYSSGGFKRSNNEELSLNDYKDMMLEASKEEKDDDYEEEIMTMD